MNTHHDTTLLLTCEHAGNRIPGEYQPLFVNAQADLMSHRGWDPGALPVAQALARHFGVPVIANSWSRLLVEANRSPTNRDIWSTYTAGLPRSERAEILERYWWPHRLAVESAVDEASGDQQRVVHVAVHSFTNVKDGAIRNADIGLLYDPRRPSEKAFCQQWQMLLEQCVPRLRVRRNYPYRGQTDGLPTSLRRRVPDGSYIGVELEVNQQLLLGAQHADVRDALIRSLEALLRSPGDRDEAGAAVCAVQ